MGALHGADSADVCTCDGLKLKVSQTWSHPSRNQRWAHFLIFSTCSRIPHELVPNSDFSMSFLVWNSWQVGSVELEAQDLDEALADVRTPRNCGRCPGGPGVVVPAVPCSTPRLDGCNMCIAGLRCRRKSQGRKSAKSAKTRCQPP
jgi:hypothetical protein